MSGPARRPAAASISAAVARVPLRQIGGADVVERGERQLGLVVDDGLPAGDGERTLVDDRRCQPATRDVGDGQRARAGRTMPTTPTARRRSACRTATPRRRTGRGARSVPTGGGRSAVRARCARARRTRPACRASRSRRRSTGCARTRRRATPPTRCCRRSSPRRGATPTATCPGRRARLAHATWMRPYRQGARSPGGTAVECQAGPSRSQRLPAMSTNTATRPYGSVRGWVTKSTPAAAIRS